MDALDARTEEYNDNVNYNVIPHEPRPDVRKELWEMLSDPKLDETCRKIITTVLTSEAATSQRKIADFVGVNVSRINAAIKTMRKCHT